MRRVQYLRRELDASDLARFELYAGRIVHLADNMKPGPPVTWLDQTFLRALSLYYGPSTPFTQLFTLECRDRILHSEGPPGLDGWTILCSPRLHNLTINTDVDIGNDALPSLLTFVTRCPSMQQLILHFPVSSVEGAATLTGVVRAIKTLNKFVCGFLSTPLPIELLAALAALPHLNHLDVQLIPGYDFQLGQRLRVVTSEVPRDRSVFDETTHFGLEVDRPQTYHTVLAGMAFKKLERAIILLSTRGHYHNIGPCFTALRDSCAPNFSGLVELYYEDCINTLRIRDPYISIAARHPITLDTLAPLLSFHSLEGVFIKTMNPVQLTDQDVDTLAAAWPRLRYLQLDCAVEAELLSAYECVTLAGLASLARRCPRLEYLDLFVGASERHLPDDIEVPAEGKGGCLKRLTVQDSLCDQPEKVAAFLRNLFPSLRIINTNGPHTGPDANPWKRVAELLVDL